MKFTGHIQRIFTNEDGETEIVLTSKEYGIDGELKQIKDLDLTIEMKKSTKCRSLNANAYFHLLIGEIAKVTHNAFDEVKKGIVCDYGTRAAVVRLPASVNVNDIYPYAKWIGDSKGTKEPCCDYIFFKQTHTLDTAEMSRLIEGTVQEAKQLGIETKTPNEIAEMLSYGTNN